MSARCWKCKAIQPATFGELVKDWRGDRTLRQAGDACGVSASTLSRAENGELPDLRTFIAIVDASGVDTEFALYLVRSQLPSAPEASLMPTATATVIASAEAAQKGQT